MKITLDLQGNTLTYENDVVSDITEMGHAFGDGEDGNEFCYARTWQDFIGKSLHLIQQTGGILKLNGQQISALTFADTNGSSVTQDTIVMLENGEKLALSQMLR
jgi:hypothetical protein